MNRGTRPRWSCAAAAASAILLFSLVVPAADQKQDQIDWAYAQKLYQKSQGGQTLTAEEQAYLDRAKQERQKAAMSRPAAPTQPGQSDIDWNYAKQLMDKINSGKTLTAEERAYLEKAQQERQKRMTGGSSRPSAFTQPTTTATGLIPLDQMTDKDKYKGQDGGLYGGGKNEPPEEHQKAARKELARIVPLDAKGNPAADGKIALISIGMSNTTQEFSKFKELADKDAAKSPQVTIVDGAQGGQDAARWSDQDAPAWKVLDQRLQAAGVTLPQVQAAWVKHARIGPASYGDFPKHAEELKDHILLSLQIARQRFPNLRVAYLSSRIYAGYASTQLNPEPYAYESAFAVRWLIQDQIKGDAKLNCDASKGQVKAPLLLWGPYLWSDGLTPRKSDGLVWKRDDLAGDGTHPSMTAGREKVGELLLTFFKTNPNAKGWFVKPGATGKP